MTAFLPLQSYTAGWHRHVYISNISRVIMWNKAAISLPQALCRIYYTTMSVGWLWHRLGFCDHSQHWGLLSSPQCRIIWNIIYSRKITADINVYVTVTVISLHAAVCCYSKFSMFIVHEYCFCTDTARIHLTWQSFGRMTLQNGQLV